MSLLIDFSGEKKNKAIKEKQYLFDTVCVCHSEKILQGILFTSWEIKSKVVPVVIGGLGGLIPKVED